MWKEVQISGKKYFILVEFTDESVDCILYDGKESWQEKQSLAIILKRAKELNKRIQFDETTIKATLQNETPTEVIKVNDEADVDCDESFGLKLKYRVQSCPLNFTWYFCKQTEHDFQQFILFPLFRIVQGLTQQNEELREVVRKKDVEIEQYKLEGAKLKRVTVATHRFDFKAFDKKYAPTNVLTESINQISDLLKAQYTPMQTAYKSSDVEDDTKKEDDVKLTPRRRRRKILEDRERIIAEKLKIRGKPLEYESSQSEQLSISSPEILDADKTKKANTSSEKKPIIDVPKEAKESAHESQLPSPSKNLRVQKESIKSSPEKISALRKRKLTNFVDYEDNSQSSSDEKVNVDEKPEAVSNNQSKIQSNSPGSEPISEDIKRILDEWKELEERRVADLQSIRTTRTGKRKTT